MHDKGLGEHHPRNSQPKFRRNFGTQCSYHAPCAVSTKMAVARKMLKTKESKRH